MATPSGKGAKDRISSTRTKASTGKHVSNVDDFSHVPKNEHGGVLVSEDELKAAFDFFDTNGSGKITLQNLKSRLGAFYKNMPIKEYKFLMNNQSELSLQDLKDLLMNNEVTNFDPVAEAFKAYDPENTGFVDQDVLRNVFENLGFGQITDDDMKILLETGDVDQDGRISLEDFRNMIEVDAGEPL
jgi:Ca2+-binding EF-hand superfamily protein